MRKAEVITWCNNNSPLVYNEKDILENHDNSFNIIKELELNTKIKEIPFKINLINGSFKCYGCELESFKNFPTKVNGFINAAGNSFKSWENWEVEFCTNITIAGKDCNLKNLNGLYETSFGRLIVRHKDDTMFENITTLSKYHNYLRMENRVLDYSKFLNMKELGIVSNELNENIIDEYLINILDQENIKNEIG